MLPTVGFGGGHEQAVVRADERAAALGLDCNLAILPDVQVDDSQRDRVAARIRHAVRQEQGPGHDVERTNEMGDVDDRAVRRDIGHHGVADADPLVAQAEVAEKDDLPGLRRHSRRSSHLAVARCNRRRAGPLLPPGGDETTALVCDVRA